jgi:hypothetical protein
MAQLLTLPLYRLTDSSGIIIPNGRLYSFETGTLTPAATYTTAALNVSHGAYVEADSAGLLPPIYLDPLVSYRFQVRASPYSAVVSGMDFDPVTAANAANLVFTQAGTGAVPRTTQDKLREGRSIADYGAISNLTTDNSDALDATVAALPTYGGAIKVNGGNYRLNGVLNQDCVILRGDGGCVEYDQAIGFHGAFAKGLRPYATGVGTATLQIGNDDQNCRRIGLHDLAISGDDGSGSGSSDGNQAAAALAIRGGTVHLSMSEVGIRDGVITVDMNPSNGLPITCNYFTNFDWRNNTTLSAARTLKVQRHDVSPDPAGAYFTHNILTCGHMNGPANGFCIEADAGTSPGVALQMSHVYCDVLVDHGVLLKGSAWIEAWDLTLDPGSVGGVVVKTTNLKFGGGDITAYMKGFIKHGGQSFEWGGGEVVDIPSDVQFFFPRPRIFQPFLSDTIYFSPASDPFSTDVFLDWATDVGPMRLHGIQFKYMDTTDSNSSTTGSVQLLGGMGVAKSIVSGAAIGCTSGFYHGADKVVSARQAAIADPTGGGTVDTQARAQLALALAALRAHGLIAT